MKIVSEMTETAAFSQLRYTFTYGIDYLKVAWHRTIVIPYSIFLGNIK